MAAQNRQNATSASPASAGGQTTGTSGGSSGGLPETGPLPRSALSNALVPTFESQSPGQIDSQGTPAVDAGQAPPDQDNPADQPAITDVQEEPTEPAEPEEGQPEASEDVNQGQPGDGDGEPAVQDQVLTDDDQQPPSVQKRFDRLTARIKQLEAQLSGQTAAAAAGNEEAPVHRANGRPAAPVPEIDEITDPARLDELETITQDGLIEAENLLNALPVSPSSVERSLRGMGIKLQNGQGEEDYSTESMLTWLTGVRTQFRQRVRAIPKRRGYLAKFAVEHEKAIVTFPWMGKREDERNALMGTFLAQAPGLRSAPNHEYWLGCAITGHLMLEQKKQQQARTGGTPPQRVNPKQIPRPGPGTGATTGARPRAANNAAVVREKALKTPTKANLAEYLQSTRFHGA